MFSGKEKEREMERKEGRMEGRQKKFCSPAKKQKRPAHSLHDPAAADVPSIPPKSTARN